MPSNINNDKNYYLDFINNDKQMDFYERLQIDKSFFDNYKEEDFKVHVKKLYSAFYPGFIFNRINVMDKENTSFQDQIIWELIVSSAVILRDTETRAQYFKLISEAHRDPESEFSNLDGYKIILCLDFHEWLFDRKAYRSLLASPFLTEKILNLFKRIKQKEDSKRDHHFDEDQDEHTKLSKQIEVFHNAILALCKTGDDWYLLYKLSINDDFFHRHTFIPLAKAASKGHWVAIMTISFMALNKVFDDSNGEDTKYITWALECIAYLEQQVIPELETKDNSDNNLDLVTLREGSTRARKLIDFVCAHSSSPNLFKPDEFSQGKAIPPSNSEDFNKLTSLIKAQKACGDTKWEKVSDLQNIIEMNKGKSFSETNKSQNKLNTSSNLTMPEQVLGQGFTKEPITINNVQQPLLFNPIDAEQSGAPTSAVDSEDRNKVSDNFYAYMNNSEPRTSNLYHKIEVMKVYGEKLSSANQNKGRLVQNLAQNLENKLDFFLREATKKQPSNNEIDLFKQDFTQTIKDKEPELSQHQEQWKPILVNILIALTGVGIFAQIIKFVFHAYEASQQKKSLSFNEALFFGKPKSQQLSEEIKDNMYLIKNDALNPSPIKPAI